MSVVSCIETQQAEFQSQQDSSPERLNQLADQLNIQMGRSMKDLMSVNRQTMLLSINAQIEAARAGEAGAAFAVVAREIKGLSETSTSVFEELSNGTKSLIMELQNLSRVLARDVRGVRLSDLALNNIDLIDRNLYERSCDVRWWATDGSVVQAAGTKSGEDCRYAGERLGQILDSYTVYYDLVLCDLDGNVIANGRPRQFHSHGKNVSQAQWFQSAMETKSGDEFGFETVHESPLVGNQRILAYSCGVRSEGKASGQLLGILGILFNWDSLAQAIVNSVPLPVDEIGRTRCAICDSSGRVLADSRGRMLRDTISFSQQNEVFEQDKGFVVDDVGGQPCLIAHAFSPGYETYSTGWHSLIIQTV